MDRGRVMQALLNILSNVSKYSPAGSSIHVRASLVNDDLYVTVRDEADGFDLDTREIGFLSLTSGPRARSIRELLTQALAWR